MKRLLTIFAALVLFIAADITPQEKYITEYSQIAVDEMNRSGVPASVTLAQGLLESRAGLSPLAKKGNNHFGIKCHNWNGKKMYHDDDKAGECFRVYPSAAASFSDHSDFLRYSDRYKRLFELKVTDYKGWARGLKEAGYATDPAYAAKLIKTIEDYQLYRFDTGARIEVPTPLQAEEIVPVKEEKQTESSLKTSERVRFPLSNEQTAKNGIPFVYSLKGESYESIASANKLFVKEILRINDVPETVDPKAVLKTGTIVYLQPKARKAAKGLDKYIVAEDGEDLAGIAQRFAVRKASLKRMNKLPDDAVLKAGDTLVLR